MVHLGGATPRWDWGGDGDEFGEEALLPQLSAARLLSSIACLRARMRFEESHSQQAMDDLMDAMTLSRHISLDGSLISILVGYAIDGHVSELLASDLPKLNAEMVR